MSGVNRGVTLGVPSVSMYAIYKTLQMGVCLADTVARMKLTPTLALSLVLALLSVGCTTVGGNKQRASVDISARQTSTPSSQLVNQGLEYLRERNYEDAQKVFSAAVKLSPTSATVHILNGISYHLDYLKGVPDSKTLAETAYGVAYALDKTDPMPLIQLGRLHVDSGEYKKAKKDFVRAVAVSPQNADAFYGLLQASLLLKDTKTGLWAGEQLVKLDIGSAEHQKILALTYAIAGKQDLAAEQYKKYEANPDAEAAAVARLGAQLDFIARQNNLALAQMNQGDYLKTAAVGGGGGNAANVVAPAVVAQKAQSNAGGQGSGSQGTGNLPSGGQSSGSKGGGTAPNVVSKKIGVKAAVAKKAYNTSQNNSDSDDSSDDDSSDDSSDGSSSASSPTSATPMGGAGQGGMGGGSGGGGGGSGGYTAAGQGQQRQRWFDCDTKPGLGKAPGGGYGVPVGGTSGDQTLYLEPLPAPCQGQAPPKMAMIDAVLIRTVDISSSSNGINLLQGLQIFGGAQRTTTTGQMPINASVMGVGTATAATLNSVSGLVSYSMNIANAVTSTSQVVAKPTLTALDRIPSTFYSGQVQTVGLNGGGVSGAQVSNVPTGTSLSITPTFIDEDTMMLAVKVSRSFIDSTSPVGGFNAGISTQNHNVTANVKIRFGETLILDGLTDREYDKNRNGVPVLQDIPIIQYLFSNVTKSTYSENVIVLVTPRRVVSNEADMKKLEADTMRRTGRFNPQELSVYQQITLFNKLQTAPANADVAFNALNRDSSFFREVKNDILINNDWISESETKRFLDSAANMIYFR